MVARYRRDYPQVRLCLLSRSVAQAIELARHNDANLGIIPGRPLPDDLVFHDWLTFAVFLLLPPGHQLVRRGKPAIWDLLNEAVVTRFPLIVPDRPRTRASSTSSGPGSRSPCRPTTAVGAS